MTEGRDIWWHDLIADVSEDCPAEPLDSESPLFILYTSGSTGKPKGILHTTAGYQLYARYTFELVFDHREEDIYWCTADCGWITGHSMLYMVRWLRERRKSYMKARRIGQLKTGSGRLSSVTRFRSCIRRQRRFERSLSGAIIM